MDNLVRWNNSEYRKPLLLMGVRQCGKTYLLKAFGEKHFPDVAYFNFESQEFLRGIFEEDLNVNRIVTELGIVRKKVILKETLLIFDEIQFCPKALTSLKYFAENLPEQAVACAGSLLGIALSKPSSFPVGKVNFLTLYPLNFKEFLLANDEELLVTYLDTLPITGSIKELFRTKLSGYLKQFLITGGMPEVVNRWMQNKNLEEVEAIQQNIIASYQFDFDKHAPLQTIPKLSLLWKSIPEQLAKENKKFVYGNVRKGFRAKDLETALQWLMDVGLAYKVMKISKPGMPISTYADSSFFKLYLFDVGLLRKMSGLPADEILKNDNKNFREFKGSLMEDFVLTELISYFGVEPYFWKSGNKAEVDLVVQIGKHVVPMEVKSCSNTKAKSLREYVTKYQPTLAFIVSNKNAKRMELKTGEMNEESGSVKKETATVHSTRVESIPLTMIWKVQDYLL